jgi:AcrR family transcriptional regulator
VAQSNTPARRTQAERKETTIAAIMDATIAALDEVGYGRTTVQQIATRAGVSAGAIFRHFPSRLDVIVEAAEEVGRRQVAEFLELMSTASVEGTPPIRVILAIFHTIARAPYGTLWDELSVHARTDPELRERLTPTVVADRDPAEAKALRNLTISVFSSEFRFRMTDDDPHLSDATIDLLTKVAHSLGID